MQLIAAPLEPYTNGLMMALEDKYYLFSLSRIRTWSGVFDVGSQRTSRSVVSLASAALARSISGTGFFIFFPCPCWLGISDHLQCTGPRPWLSASCLSPRVGADLGPCGFSAAPPVSSSLSVQDRVSAPTTVAAVFPACQDPSRTASVRLA